MKIRKKISIILFILIFFYLPIYIFNAYGLDLSTRSNNVEIVQGQFVVKFKPYGILKSANYAALSNVLSMYNVKDYKQVFRDAKNEKVKGRLNLNNVFVMRIEKSANIWQIVAELNSNPDVAYAEPVYLNKIEVDPNDPLFSFQNHLPQIFAPEAWDIQYGDSTVIIGMIDTGVEWIHEDLADVIWPNEDEVEDGTDTDGNGFIDDIRGWDYVTGVSGDGPYDAAPGEDGEVPDNNPMDFDGHGTHTAGIAAAHTNNNLGIASVSSGALIMPLRIGWHANDGNGYGYSS